MLTSNSSQLTQACRVLENGGVIVCPTDTIPGLSCLATQPDALRRIFAIKQRPADNGLILISNKVSLVQPYLEPLNASQLSRINDNDEPTTWLAEARPTVDKMITGKHSTLAFRICAHEVVTHLCDALQQPLVSTSANVHGKATATSNEEIDAKIKEQVEVVLTGSTGTRQASIIKRLDNGTVIRE